MYCTKRKKDLWMPKFLVAALVLLSVIGTGGKLIYDEMVTLKRMNAKLVAKQKSYETKTKNNKKRMQKHRKALISKKLARAKFKLANAPLKMIPFVGTTAIVAATANDIHNYCQDIKEFKAFEVTLFGSLDDNVTKDEEQLCGFDIGEDLLPLLENYTE